MPTKDKKVIGADDTKENSLKAQWSEIQRNYPMAYEDLMEFMDTTKEMLIRDASDVSITINGERHAISGEMMNFLLQRRAGIDIVKTYIRLFSE